MSIINLIPSSVEENNSDSPKLKSRIIQMLTDRASGGKVKGELSEENPLEFEYADMRISAHLRNHYDGMMIREGGALLLVMNAHITNVPNDKIVFKKALELGSRYPSTSVCMIPLDPRTGAAGRLEVYSVLVAATMTHDELDLALRSMVQHYHNVPLELGTKYVDPKRRQIARDASLRKSVKSDKQIFSKSLPDDAGEKISDDKIVEKIEIDESLLKDSLAGLNQLVGLNSVKEQIANLVALARFNSARGSNSTQPNADAPHMVFVGNPGTCKTTVAGHLGNIYKALGILRSGHVKVTSRADLVGGYVGQTAPKVRNVCRAARNGVLFIDEAYSLSESKDEFGQEAIETLLLEMENNRGRLAVVIAGYPDLMKSFIASNPGLQSRFDRQIVFDDYSDAELVEIFILFASKQNLVLGDGALDTLRVCVGAAVRGMDFGNGREARRWLEASVEAQARSWVEQGGVDENALKTLSAESITAGFKVANETPKQPTSCVGYL